MSLLLAACALAMAGAVAAADAQESPVATQIAARAKVASGFDRLKSLDAAQARTLRRAKITSLAKLSQQSAASLAKLLKVDAALAGKIVKEAQIEKKRLNAAYLRTRSRYAPVQRASPEDQEAAEYAALVAPTNECTILVRWVCGSENQCASSPGCPVAKQLLQLYNDQGGDPEVAEGCLISLQDDVIFNHCNQ
jgi:hypothetical protein